MDNKEPQVEKKVRKAPVRKIPAGIVTKDSNNAAEIPLELSRESFVKEEVREDFGFVTQYNAMDEISRTRTIDAELLPKERFKQSPRLMNAKRKSRSTTLMHVDAAERYEPNVTTGLSQERVDARVENGYVNFTKKKSSKSVGRILFNNLLTPINLIAAMVAVALLIFSDLPDDLPQLFFMVIILINTGIGIFQEIRAKITVDRLSIMNAPTAVVVRDGERKVIPVTEVVLDDIMYIELGKQICADSIVISGEVEANEALITGESVPVRKAVGETLYSGSYLSSGACYARVNKVGASNYVEMLTSHAKKYKKPKSELFNSINFIIKIVIPLAAVLTVATLVTFYFREIAGDVDVDTWDLWRRNVEQAAGLMIGMLPVGMFLLTSTALFVSVIKLGKRKALVKDFNCIEMLARVDVLCLDKTGTITDGTMTVKDVVEIKSAAEMSYTLNEIVGSVLTATGDNNQTARALADKFGYSQALTPTAIIPFSSQRKLAAVSFGGAGTFIYGAPEFVLKDMGVRIEKMINQYASEGYRVLVVAHSSASIVGEKLPSVRRPLCLLVIEDYIRDDAITTVKWFKENNVQVKVISGDNPITVSEVAKRVGVENAELYISLEGLNEREVLESATKYTVFGRVSPEQKKLLVQALKGKGHTVAMTGDGVNDILAMRESDCAIAIASGSEAARNIAHLVLQDSNFTSMPQVVIEGRKVINNIQKTSALFLMKTVMTMILAVVFLFIQSPYPYRTHYLLLMEMFVIALASFALALQSNTNLIKGKFLSNVIGRSAPGGITLAISMIALYIYQTIVRSNGGIYDYIANGYYPSEAVITTTMAILGVTFTGFIVLIKICEPPDMYRVVMLLAVAVFLFVAAFITPLVPLLSGILDRNFMPSALSLPDVLFLIVTVLGSYFFMSILIRIMKAFKILNN